MSALEQFLERPLLAGSTYSTSLPDSCRCVFWMAGLETEFHQALLGQMRKFDASR